MSSTTLKGFCIFIAFGFLSSWPALAHALTPQGQVSRPSLTPNQTPPSSSALFEQQQEERALQQEQWQQQQEQWQQQQDLNFQRQYSQQQQELEHQQELRLRAK